MNWDQWKHLLDVFAWVVVCGCPIVPIIGSLASRLLTTKEVADILRRTNTPLLIKIPWWTASLSWLIAM